jgi:sec-independent protein translocase protein TatC
MPAQHDYSEDLFADTRMTFGEHIEELRAHLLRAIKGLIFCLTIGFVLDGIGLLIGSDKIGIGRPMMDVITAPVTRELRAFYNRRLEKLEKEAEEKDQAAVETTRPRPIKLTLSPQAQAAILRRSVPEDAGPVEIEVLVNPVQLYKFMQPVTNVVRGPELAALTVTEPFVVYFKVSILCGLVIASPYVFYQLWSFIAAGLYPHEKRLVHYFLPFSTGLFVIGAVFCEFYIIPKSIEALLWFNEWLNVAPELRLNDWLSFAIMLPVVFGLSFQTPLVMLFLNWIGVMTAASFLSYWRIAVFVLAVLAAVITPTPDAFNWFLMWAPMMGLYVLGIGLCKLSEKRRGQEDYDVPEPDELIEV